MKQPILHYKAIAHYVYTLCGIGTPNFAKDEKHVTCKNCLRSINKRNNS